MMFFRWRLARTGLATALIAFAPAATLVLAPVDASAQAEIRFATAQAPDSVIQKRSYGVWADEVSKASGGAIKVVSYPPPFATTTNMWDRVIAGVADIGVVALANSGIDLNASYVVSLPALGRDTEAASVALWRLYERGMLEDAFDDVKVLGFQAVMSLSLYSHQPITSMEDLSGLRVRVTDRNTSAMMEALGAAPVSIPFSEAYQAVSRGVVDAALGNGNSMVVFRFRELLSNEVTNVAFGMTPFVFAMNKSSYENLPPEGKAALDAWVGERLSRFLGAEQNALVVEFNEDLVSSGDLTQHELPSEERQRWIDAMKPVVQTWVAETPNGQAVLDAYLEEYEKVAAPE